MLLSPQHLPGIGLEAAKFLAASGDWHVIMAVRAFSKAEAAAKTLGMDPSSYTVMDLDLASLNSVRNFAKALKAAKIKPDALVCNAAVWYPKVRRDIVRNKLLLVSLGCFLVIGWWDGRTRLGAWCPVVHLLSFWRVSSRISTTLRSSFDVTR